MSIRWPSIRVGRAIASLTARASRSLSRAVADLGDDDELVAAEAGEAGAFGRDRAQPAADFGEHLVADRVAERVVDFLEPVEVEPEHRQLAALGQRRQHLDHVVVEARRGWRAR